MIKTAIELHITVDEELVKQQVENVQGRYPDIAPEKLRKLIEKDLLFQKMIQHIQQEKAAQIVVSDEEARKFYEEQKEQIMNQLANQIDTIQQELKTIPNKERRQILESQLKILKAQQAIGPFSKPEQVRASHILVKVAPQATREEKDAAREKIKEILEQAKAGKDFAALAKAYSECPSGEKGGDLGYFGRNEMVQPFEDVAFTLPVGVVSDVVETRFGYHLIKVTDKKSRLRSLRKTLNNLSSNRKSTLK